jgi:DNA repair protein RecO (recombination protein O)
LLTTEAVVIGSTNLVEADRIVSVYSPQYGQIRGVAHGVKRIKNPFGSALEPLTHIHLIFKARPNRELQIIRQADIINGFQALRGDIIRLTAGLYGAELVQRLTPVGGEGQPPVFDLLLGYLELLTRKTDLVTLMRILELRLLTLLGYGPQLEHCQVCAATLQGHGWGFSPVQGGLVCPRCRHGVRDTHPVSPGGVMFLRQAMTMDLERIGRLRLLPSAREELECALQGMLMTHGGTPIKSYPVLKRLLHEG